MRSIDRPGNSNKKRIRNRQRRSRLRRSASRPSSIRPKLTAIAKEGTVDPIAPAASPLEIQT